MQPLIITSKVRNYEVLFSGKHAISKYIKDQQDIGACFVIDCNVWKLYSTDIFHCIDPSKLIIIDAKEDNKTYETVLTLYEKFIEYSINRRSAIITIGGGITQDIVGFACSTFYRGVDWVFIPTTLLAQADSCIGGKTSLNLAGYKNVIGTFYPPTQVMICIDFL